MERCGDTYICRDCIHLEFRGKATNETYTQLSEWENQTEPLAPIQRALLHLYRKAALDLMVQKLYTCY